MLRYLTFGTIGLLAATIATYAWLTLHGQGEAGTKLLDTLVPGLLTFLTALLAAYTIDQIRRRGAP